MKYLDLLFLLLLFDFRWSVNLCLTRIWTGFPYGHWLHAHTWWGGNNSLFKTELFVTPLNQTVERENYTSHQDVYVERVKQFKDLLFIS